MSGRECLRWFSIVCTGRLKAGCHHLLCNTSRALSDWLQLQLGCCSQSFQYQPWDDGECVNPVTPAAPVSLQLVYARYWMCELQLCTQLSIATCFICVCTHSQRWAQSSLSTVANLWKPAAFLWHPWELFRETVLNRRLPKTSKQWNF